MAFFYNLLSTVPNLFFNFLSGSNFLEAPKSITFKFAFYLFESNNKFSGLRSLKKVNRSCVPMNNILFMAILNS